MRVRFDLVIEAPRLGVCSDLALLLGLDSPESHDVLMDFLHQRHASDCDISSAASRTPFMVRFLPQETHSCCSDLGSTSVEQGVFLADGQSWCCAAGQCLFCGPHP